MTRSPAGHEEASGGSGQAGDAARQIPSTSGAGRSAPRHLDHYVALGDAESQTSPQVIRDALTETLGAIAFEGPTLDVGAGVGSNLDVLVRHHQVCGVDVAASALQLARRIAPVAAADGAALPFRTSSFGSATCTEVLEHVDDPARVLAEIARVVAPGGFVYVTAPNYSNLAGVHKQLADWRSGRQDWNPWGAHEGGFEAFMTGRRLWRAARGSYELVSVRALDYGQALTGRFVILDRLATSATGQRLLRRLLPRLHRARRGPVPWHGMHVEMVLRTKRAGG